MSGAAAAGAGWQASVVVPAPAVPAFEVALAGEDGVVSSFVLPDAAYWRVDAWFPAAPDRTGLVARLAAAAAAGGLPVPELTLGSLPERDWLADSLEALPPLRAGRFYLHGAHHRGSAPAGALALEIEAGAAFGSGRHETTRGCLLALDRLARLGGPRRVLDLGCGSGVLALAAAALWHRPVVAADIDPRAVAVCRANARLNGLGPWLAVRRADGPRHRELRAGGPYDLILANILARPLVHMAGPVCRLLAPGGVVVLSGLLADQERWVYAAYAGRGLRLWRRIRLGPWPTLMLRRSDRPVRAK